MRRRVAWLVAATTSAVVLAFVIPLCLLVRTMAEDRGMASANQEARNVAILVSGLHDDPRLGQLISAVERRGPARTSVLIRSSVGAVRRARMVPTKYSPNSRSIPMSSCWASMVPRVSPRHALVAWWVQPWIR